MRKMMCDNHSVDLVNINAYIKFGEILSISSQDIEWKQIFGINHTSHIGFHPTFEPISVFLQLQVHGHKLISDHHLHEHCIYNSKSKHVVSKVLFHLLYILTILLMNFSRSK